MNKAKNYSLTEQDFVPYCLVHASLAKPGWEEIAATMTDRHILLLSQFQTKLYNEQVHLKQVISSATFGLSPFPLPK